MDAEELTEQQIAELRGDLAALREELTGLLAAHAEGAAVVDLDTPIGRLSRMDAMQQQQMSAASLRATERRLQQIEQALRTVDDDDYGLCRKCDEPIGYRRLKARPETPLCVGCQGGLERR